MFHRCDGSSVVYKLECKYNSLKCAMMAQIISKGEPAPYHIRIVVPTKEIGAMPEVYLYARLRYSNRAVKHSNKTVILFREAV